jgi:anthranilate phosphoribosyltransferase
VAELQNGKITRYTIAPERFGLQRAPLNELAVDSAAASLKILRTVLDGASGPARDIVLLNAGAALYAADLEGTLHGGVARAALAIDSGAARGKFDELIAFSQSLAQERHA